MARYFTATECADRLRQLASMIEDSTKSVMMQVDLNDAKTRFHLPGNGWSAPSGCLTDTKLIVSLEFAGKNLPVGKLCKLQS